LRQRRLFPDAAVRRMIAPHKTSERRMDPIIIALAKAAGLENALALFPEDVQAAAEQAFDNAKVVKVPVDPEAEPWPPMRAGIGL
jgi:thiamine pyrophosphate-dependent acetolactate synthase large subunit-like protein